MESVRFGAVGNEKPGVLDAEGKRRDLSSRFTDWDMSFFDGDGLAQLWAIRDLHQFPFVAESERWIPGWLHPMN
jgi:2,4-didehydro-3-deoxy-L-rhamnonate hydrolase